MCDSLSANGSSLLGRSGKLNFGSSLSERRYRRTVLRDSPVRREISRIEKWSRKCQRRMTLNTPVDHSVAPGQAKGARFEHGSVLGGKTRAAWLSSQWKSTHLCIGCSNLRILAVSFHGIGALTIATLIAGYACSLWINASTLNAEPFGLGREILATDHPEGRSQDYDAPCSRQRVVKSQYRSCLVSMTGVGGLSSNPQPVTAKPGRPLTLSTRRQRASLTATQTCAVQPGCDTIRAAKLAE
jgi:hypothetical protein